MSPTPFKRDPFGPVATAAAYVPRPATEEAFARLESAVFEDERIGVLQGPAGLGKTMLLRRLAEAGRDSFSPVYLPYAALAPDELCSWILESLGAKAADDPPTVFRAWLGHLVRQGVPLLLLVDDATALPADSAAWLVQLAKERVLRLVLAGLEGEGPAAFRDVLPEDAERIRLAEPMSEEETRDYLSARLDMAEVPEAQRAAFDRKVVGNLFELSHGNPRRLHQAASAILRGARPDAIVAFMDGQDSPPPPEAPPAPEPFFEPPTLEDAILEPLYAGDEPEFEEAEAAAPEESLELDAPQVGPRAFETPEEEPEFDSSESIELAEPVGPITPLESVQPAAAQPEAAPSVHGEIMLASNALGRPGSLLLRRTGPRAALAPIAETSQIVADTLGEDGPELDELEPQSEAPAAAPLDDDLPEPARIAARAAEPQPDLEDALREAGQSLVQATGLLREATVALGVPGTPRGDARAALRDAVLALRDAITTADSAVGEVAGPGRQREPEGEIERGVLLAALARVGIVIGVSALLGAATVIFFRGGSAPEPLRPVVQQSVQQTAPQMLPAEPPLPRLADAPELEPAPAPEAAVAEAPAAPPVEELAPPVEELVPPAETFSIGVNARPWAHVEVDGRDVGMTPIAALELEEGLHIFRARMPDGRIVVRRVEIGPETEPLVFR